LVGEDRQMYLARAWLPYVQQNMKKSVAAVNDVEGNMAEDEKEFIDLRAPDGEEKTFMDVELESENIFQDEVEWR
jgi:hypothetical protein